MFYYAVSDKGAVKETNQDSVLIKKLKTEQGDTCVLGCVCDGLGGLSAGEMASCTAAMQYGEWFVTEFPHFYPDVNTIKVSLAELSQQINRRIYYYGKENAFRVGTTTSGVLLMGNTYLTFNVGDSRVYRCRDGNLSQLTKDNSFVQEEIDAGRMTQEEALKSGKDHVLTRCLGGFERLESVDFTVGEVLPGDIFMFCSDGGRHKISSEEYGRILSNVSSKENLKTLLPQVVSEVIRRGEEDNISIGCIYV